MKLAGVNILIDGYNLSMEKGTGIKTYGINLLDIIRKIGGNPGVVLFDFDFNYYGIDEVLLFDAHDWSSNDSNKKLRKIFSLIKHITRPQTRKLELSYRSVPPERFEFVAKKSDLKTFISPGYFKESMRLFKATGLLSQLNFKENIDIWHMTYPMAIKVKNAKTVVTIHDLIPLKVPWSCLDEKVYWYKLVKKLVNESDLIISVSENTKKDILDYFDIDEGKICVTYQKVEPLIKTLGSSSSIILKQNNLKPGSYFLFVGNIEPKKNLRKLLEAYLNLNTDISLVVAGSKGWLWEKELDIITKFKNNKNSKSILKKIIFLDYVTKKDLIDLYTNALCLVFPSLYEGFGLPPLESMSAGCPVITSNVSSLPEVCGDAALYVNPYESDDIKLKMEMIINDIDNGGKLRQVMIEKGYKQFEFFSEENYADRLYNAYSKVL